MAIPPWFMWGTTVDVATKISAIPSPDNTVTQQIARVNYARPDTWSFFFSALVTGSPPAADGVISIQVLWDLIIGVGRSQTSLPGFAFMLFNGNGVALANSHKWTSATRAPELVDPGTNSYRPDFAHFPASDIQLSARVAAFQGGGGPAVGAAVRMQLAGYFAPRSHYRPEWNEINPRFPGGENHGL